MIESRLQRLLSLKQLRLVSLLEAERNLSRCAELLHTSQPAVSRLLARMEALIGHRLFDRTTKRVVPTSAGLHFIHLANRILGELSRAEQQLRGKDGFAPIELRVGMLDVFSQDLLAKALVRLHALMPAVAVRVRVAPPQTLYEQLLDGTIDAMLAHVEFAIDLKQVEVVPLYEERNVVLAGVGASLARKRRATWQELAQHAWVLPPPGTPLRPKLDRMLSVHRRPSAPVRDIETDSALLAVRLIRHHPMLWAIARRHAELWIRSGDAVPVNAPSALVKGPFCAMRLHRTADHPACRQLIECLCAEVHPPP